MLLCSCRQAQPSSVAENRQPGHIPGTTHSGTDASANARGATQQRCIHLFRGSHARGSLQVHPALEYPELVSHMPEIPPVTTLAVSSPWLPI